MKKYFEITWRLWKLLKPFHRYFYLQLFLTIIIQLLALAATLVVAKILNNTVLKDWNLVSIFLIIYFIILIIHRILYIIHDKQDLEKAQGKLNQFIREISLKKILSLNASQHLENNSAIKITIVNRGEESFQYIIETLLLSILPVIFNLSFSIITISFYSKKLELFLCIGLIISIISSYKFNNFWRPLQRNLTDKWDAQSKIKAEAYQHLRLIKLFGNEEGYLDKYFKERLEILKYSIYVAWVKIKFVNIRKFILNDLSRCTTLIITIYLYSQNQIEIGIVYAIFSLTSGMYSAMANVDSAMRNLPTSYIYIEKYLSPRTPLLGHWSQWINLIDVV